MSKKKKISTRPALPPQQGNPLLPQAIALHQQGRLAEAETLYRQILLQDAKQPDALHLLGQIERHKGNAQAGLEMVERAISLRPDSAPFRMTRGNTLRVMGRRPEAIAAYREALELNPDFADAHNNLGVALLETGDAPAAAGHFRRALEIRPAYPDAANNLGNALKATGDFDGAVDAYKRTLEMAPNAASAWTNLGSLYHKTGRWDECVECYRKALSIDPNSAETNGNLGTIFANWGRFDEARQHLEKALELRPNFPEALMSLGHALIEQGHATEGEAKYRKAIELAPDSPLVNRMFSMKLYKQRRLIEARDYALQALPHAKLRERGMLLSHIASVMAMLSDYTEVKSMSDEALTLVPWEDEVWEHRLYNFSYHSDLSAADIFGEFVRWGDGQAVAAPSSYANDRTPGRRLRVGFVSPDFRRHTSRFYFSALFEHYDREAIELIGYSNVQQPDEWTEKFRGWSSGWREIRGLSDAEVAEQVRADGIDILIDGCNHMQDHRLGVFALKPAPVQATWLGAAWTTGLSSVDYVLFDPYMAPEGTLAREAIVRLPGCFIAYRPPEGTPEVAPLPARHTGHVTFGYSGRTERLNPRVFRAWGEILSRLPEARLVLDFRAFADPQTQAYYRAYLAQHGVDTARVEMRCSADIFKGLADIDILLDCFPHSGGTMLFDALWMGVPALTLAGRPPVGRIGTSLMSNLGLADWVTHSEPEYVERAVALAGDIDALAQLRATMRTRMRASPLMDEQGFARHYGTALQTMWNNWCDDRIPEPFDVQGDGPVSPQTDLPVSSQPAVLPDGVADVPGMMGQALALHQAGRLDEAESIYRQVLAIDPVEPNALHLLGVAHHQRDDHETAQRLIVKAIAIKPSVAEFHSNLGNVLKVQGKVRAAMASYARALALWPNFAEPFSNLGNGYRELGELDRAIASCRKAIAINPALAAAHLNLGNALSDVSIYAEARDAYERGLKLEPDNIRILVSLGCLHADHGHLALARRCLSRALELEPERKEALNNLGVVVKEECDFATALSLYRKAIALAPDITDYGSNELYCLNYHPDMPAEAIFEAYRNWDMRYAAPVLTEALHVNDRSPDRRLRIGYVSPDFRRHAARHFIEPLLVRHDRSAVELFIYAEVPREDEISNQFRASVDHWCNSVGMSDEDLAARIRQDGIDILVDLAGHTRGNRLLVFARKPAPVQMSWLGYAYTTGIKAIDYFLSDSILTPEGSDALFAEKLVRLPVCLSYRPTEGLETPGELPARANGYVTFGSLSRSVRINDKVVALWAEILSRVPDSRLVLNSQTFVCPELRQRYVEKFGALGIAADRLDMGYTSPPWPVYRRIDIALDCFPHNSGTTLFEGLYMGLPFVTLQGRPSVGRMGSAILTGLGRPEWIAATPAGYVEKVVALASDLDRLAEIRRGLRQEMERSRLRDEAGFARSVEAAYDRMWRRWCDGGEPEAITLSSEGQEPAPASPEVQQLLAAALAHHQAGRLAEAEQGYKQILALDAQNADAHHLFGVLAYQVGRFDIAVQLISEAVKRRPGEVEFLANLGESLRRLGRLDEALHPLKEAVSLDPSHANAMANLGVLQADMGNLAEAEIWMRKSIALNPGNAGAQYNLGNNLKAQGRRAEALACYEAAASLQPSYVDALHQIAAIHQADDKLELALEGYRRALSVNPQHVETLNNLGVVLERLNRHPEAAPFLRKAAELRPDIAEVQCNLGVVLSHTGSLLEALTCLKRAVELKPAFVGAYGNMAAVLDKLDRSDEATAAFQQGLEVAPEDPAINRAYSIFLWRRGRLVEARERAAVSARGTSDRQVRALGLSQLATTEAYLSDYARVAELSGAALELSPTDPVIWSQRLYSLSYHPDLSAADIFGEFVRWGDGQQVSVPSSYANDRTPGRRLRVGFVSPDFRRHTSRFYFTALFEHHDRAAIELIGYSNVQQPDEWTEKFRGWSSGWREIRGLSDAEVAEQVRADGIDILIDGCNHMQDHRLGVFALKPAPVQATWLGAAWTTGLSSVDYVLFDPYMAPEGTLAREKIVRLPGCFIAYRPPEGTPEVAPLPARHTGHVTFGYSGRTERLNPRVFRAWGEILSRLPEARLVLDFRAFADPQTQAYYRAYLAQHGVDSSRVEMRCSADIFKGLGDIDILLDCFPHSGGTMLFDALWMGVPALTLAGRPPVGRIGTSLMSNLGLADWVTHSEPEYVERAVALAGDIDALADIRATMRTRMRASPLMDEAGFARHYGTALQTMWKNWCQDRIPQPFDAEG
jgi:predicted O-linked N-acetylglucosamine transferase (SPINDLY family)